MGKNLKIIVKTLTPIFLGVLLFASPAIASTTYTATGWPENVPDPGRSVNGTFTDTGTTLNGYPVYKNDSNYYMWVDNTMSCWQMHVDTTYPDRSCDANSSGIYYTNSNLSSLTVGWQADTTTYPGIFTGTMTSEGGTTTTPVTFASTTLFTIHTETGSATSTYDITPAGVQLVNNMLTQLILALMLVMVLLIALISLNVFKR